MQPTRKTPGAVDATTKSAQAHYEVFAACNKCGGVHEMGISVLLEDGPVEKKSIAAHYEGKTLPKNLAELTNLGISCVKTGRQSIQKNPQQIFLVPTRI